MGVPAPVAASGPATAERPRRRRLVVVCLLVVAVLLGLAGRAAWTRLLPSWQGRDDVHAYVPSAGAVLEGVTDRDLARLSKGLRRESVIEYAAVPGGFDLESSATWVRAGDDATDVARLYVRFYRFAATAGRSGTSAAQAWFADEARRPQAQEVPGLGDSAVETVSFDVVRERVRAGNVMIQVEYTPRSAPEDDEERERHERLARRLAAASVDLLERPSTQAR